MVVQVVTSILQLSMHCCLSRLFSDASEATAANSARVGINMARARYPDFTDFLLFAPRIPRQGNLSTASLS